MTDTKAMTEKMQERADVAGRVFQRTPHPGADDPEPDYGLQQATTSRARAEAAAREGCPSMAHDDDDGGQCVICMRAADLFLAGQRESQQAERSDSYEAGIKVGEQASATEIERLTLALTESTGESALALEHLRNRWLREELREIERLTGQSETLRNMVQRESQLKTKWELELDDIEQRFKHFREVAAKHRDELEARVTELEGLDKANIVMMQGHVEENGRLKNRVGELVTALRGLSDKLDEIAAHPEYQGVWTLAYVHGGGYAGPNWADALKAARAVLADQEVTT